MKNDESQRLFFIEIYIAIVFFLMIAVTCFMGFTKSKIMQTDANKQITYVIYLNAVCTASEMQRKHSLLPRMYLMPATVSQKNLKT